MTLAIGWPHEVGENPGTWPHEGGVWHVRGWPRPSGFSHG
jgi:hypothetical protein